MIYYKVNTTSDQVRLLTRKDTKKLNFLIKDELYTERVINSALKDGRITQEQLNTHFTKHNIAPKNTYWFFGARFESKS
jgi:hypothetical protein